MHLLSEYILGQLVGPVLYVAAFSHSCERAGGGIGTGGLLPCRETGLISGLLVLLLPVRPKRWGPNLGRGFGLFTACLVGIFSDNLRPCWHFGVGNGVYGVQVTDR